MPSTQLKPDCLTRPIVQPERSTIGLREHRYPSLYQVNTRVWLRELAGSRGERATLDDIPDSEFDRLAHAGFDWIWFLGVWQTGQGIPTLIVVVNHAPNQSQCYLRLPFDEIRAHFVRARDLMTSVAYERDGEELASHSMFLDLPPWGYHVFRLERGDLQP
jgi:hypothetical protein